MKEVWYHEWLKLNSNYIIKLYSTSLFFNVSLSWALVFRYFLEFWSSLLLFFWNLSAPIKTKATHMRTMLRGAGKLPSARNPFVWTQQSWDGYRSDSLLCPRTDAVFIYWNRRWIYAQCMRAVDSRWALLLYDRSHCSSCWLSCNPPRWKNQGGGLDGNYPSLRQLFT